MQQGKTTLGEGEENPRQMEMISIQEQDHMRIIVLTAEAAHNLNVFKVRYWFAASL